MKKSPKLLICLGDFVSLRRSEGLPWSPRQESNLYLALRRRPFYPLNYGGMRVDFLMAASGGGSWVRQTQIMSSELSSPLCARSVKRCAMR